MIGMCDIHYESFEELPQELKDKFKPNKVTKQTKQGFLVFINELNKHGDKLVGDYTNATTKILIKFNKCGHIPPKGIGVDHYKRGQGCPICSSKQVQQGINDLATTHPHLVQYFVNIEDTINYTYGSSKPVELKCPICGTVKKETVVIKNIAKGHFSCDNEQCSLNMNIRISEYTKALWDNDEYRIKQEKNYNNEEYKTKMSDISKQRWENEEYRKTMVEKIREYSWKGGITYIANYLRSFTRQWDKDVRQAYNKKCVLTGAKCNTHNSAVHHLYGFNMIVEQAHAINNIEIKPQVRDYTKEELQLLENYVLEWHKDTSNGILLSNEVHKLFHNTYGYGNNTPQQFEEFKARYLNHEFDNELN